MIFYKRIFRKNNVFSLSPLCFNKFIVLSNNLYMITNYNKRYKSENIMYNNLYNKHNKHNKYNKYKSHNIIYNNFYKYNMNMNDLYNNFYNKDKLDNHLFKMKIIKNFIKRFVKCRNL